MVTSTKEFLSIVMIFFGVIGLYLGLTSPIICLLAIFSLLFITSKNTAGFFLVMYGGVLGGTVRSLYPYIPVYGLLLNLFGLYLMKDVLKGNLVYNKKSIGYLFVTFGVFLIYYLLGPRSDYSTTKIINLVQNGIMFFLAYFVLDKSENIKIKDLSVLLMIISVYLISYAMENYGLRPSSFFDFNWFRQGLINYKWSTNEELLVDYQEVGMDATYAVALIYSLKKLPKGTYLYVAVALYLTLVAGARQSLAAFVAIIFFRHAFFSEVKSGKRIMVYLFMVILLYVVYMLLKTSNISAVSNTLDGGDEARPLIWLTAINIFLENPFLGVGLGGYEHNPLGDKWPHNFFLEILSELGICGLICLTLLVVTYIRSQRISIRHFTRTEMFYFLSLISLIVRLMVSGDFTTSIALFSAIYANSNYKRI